MGAAGRHRPGIWGVLIFAAASSMMIAAVTACRTYETPPPDVAAAGIIAHEAWPDFTYPLDLGTLRHCGSCGEAPSLCPRYDVLKEMGWLSVECREGRPRAVLTGEGNRLFRPFRGAVPSGDSGQRFIVLARWEFAGIVRMEGDADGWAEVTYRWRYAPTAAGLRFLERAYPAPPLGNGYDPPTPIGRPVEATARFLKRQGKWSYLPPHGGSGGGIYVH
jgi:hypothetical protein